MGILSTWLPIYQQSAWWLWKTEEGDGSHGTGLTDSCELLCMCWELIPSPLKEHPVLLTTMPYLWPLLYV